MTRKLVLSILLLATMAPSAAMADDATYCTDLSDLYLRYLAPTQSRRPMTDVGGATAIEECRKGNYAAGIAVLEQRLLNARFTLPKRS